MFNAQGGETQVSKPVNASLAIKMKEQHEEQKIKKKGFSNELLRNGCRT
jgi:hypothetical protein